MLEDRQTAGPEEPRPPVGPPDPMAPAEADAAPAAAPPSGRAQGRLGRFVAHRRQWLASEQVRVQAELDTRRQRSGMVDAGFLVQELDARVGGGILAGALAFRLFLFMVPVVYVVFTVLGAASRALGQDPAHLADSAGITGLLASTVVKVDQQGAWTQVPLVLGAIVAMFITAGALLKALYVVHWLIWRVPRSRPAGLGPRLVLIGITLLASALGVAVNGGDQ
jgi:hypothetical protein